jgi:ABC-type uncharacterized transport system substrate-binding protein
MRRRDFIAGLGGAVASPLRARAQRPAIPTIGYLAFAFNPNSDVATGFRQALNEAGYLEGRDVKIEFRSADRQLARLSELAADLVRSQVAVIVAVDGAAIDAAKAATQTRQLARPATNRIRSRHKSYDREEARPHRAANTFRPRHRID